MSEEIAELQYQLEQIQSALELDAANVELLTLEKELQDLIALTSAKLAPSQTETIKESAIESYAVGDTVLAKWVAGDHQFYPAKITSITGASSKPVYVVKFIDYGETVSVQPHQVKPVTESKKRAIEIARTKAPVVKVDPTAPTQPPPPPKKKIKTDNELTKAQSKWSDFARSGPKTKGIGKRKAIGESSMFRTSEEGKVGVIGSGKGMTTESRTRGRHVFDHRR